ncbi:MAG TPA: hypothetical protein VNB54_08915, partial [Alphaproteobacteria bacterium]|nr:hypothetical protein [Alphaproteobacteria bacterium]
ASAGASTSQSAQTPGASANVDGSGSANAKAPHNENKQKEKDKGAAAGTSSNGAGAAGASGASGALSSGTTLQAELSKSLDAKKAKPGDEVSAKLTQDVKENGKVVLHKGSKLVGHVTEAQAKSKENAESKLGVVFDKAVLKGGEEMAFNGVIQAVAPPVQGALSVAGDENSSLSGGMGSGSSMGGGHSGGGIAPIGAATSAAGGTVGAATGAVGNTAGSVTNSTGGAVNGTVNRTAGVAANGALNSAAHGVVGMQGVDLNTAAAGSAQGSVISSASRNIKLDSGTQMVLQVTGSAAAH